MEWFLTPNVQFGLLAILTVLGLFLPFTMLLSILILPPLMVAFTDRKFRPPLRMPKDCEMFDDTLTTETQAEYRLGPIRIPHKVRERKKAKGILYVGYERGRLFGRELWLNMTDLLRHMVFLVPPGRVKPKPSMGLSLTSCCGAVATASQTVKQITSWPSPPGRWRAVSAVRMIITSSTC